MRILVLSFYYPPDLSAGSFRIGALLEAMLKYLPPRTEIDVITTIPNRYSTFAAEAPPHERKGPIEVFRMQLPSHQSGMVDQSRAFLEFARGARDVTATRSYELVFATSSRLMTAALAAWIARRKRSRLYLDIRDIFVDTIKDVLRPTLALFAKPPFSLLERWTIGSADQVNLVSAGFLPYFRARYPNRAFLTFTNGIDREFAAAARESPARSTGVGPVIVLYAGNIGEGQGLHVVLPGLAERMAGLAHFIVIGDGGRKLQLQAALKAKQITNVELRTPIGRADLIKAYQSADVLFLHLNDYAAFEKVLPSKVFEYGALGKPLWAGVAGHAAEFIRSELDNAAVFDPCNIEQAVRAFETLEFVTRPRDKFVARYARAAIMDRMAASVLATPAKGAT